MDSEEFFQLVSEKPNLLPQYLEMAKAFRPGREAHLPKARNMACFPTKPAVGLVDCLGG